MKIETSTLKVIHDIGNAIFSIDSNHELRILKKCESLFKARSEQIEKAPFGKSQFASYVVALALLKEECELDAEQADELCEKFYRFLKDNDKFTPDLIEESSNFPNLTLKEPYRLRMQLKQNDKIYPEKTECLILGEHSYIYGIKLYVGYVDADRLLVTADDVY